MIEELLHILHTRADLFEDQSRWSSLDVDYYPPRVERVWTKLSDDRRLYIHVIHPTTVPCLFHKHRWPAAFVMLDGGYEMGLARCEDEISTEEAWKLPVISRYMIMKGSAYEMLDTHALHYVKPLGNTTSMSLMLTGPLYPEAKYRKEAEHPQLAGLSEDRKKQILLIAWKHSN
jgi:hypothetical protein